MGGCLVQLAITFHMYKIDTEWHGKWVNGEIFKTVKCYPHKILIIMLIRSASVHQKQTGHYLSVVSNFKLLELVFNSRQNQLLLLTPILVMCQMVLGRASIFVISKWNSCLNDITPAYIVCWKVMFSICLSVHEPVLIPPPPNGRHPTCGHTGRLSCLF